MTTLSYPFLEDCQSYVAPSDANQRIGNIMWTGVAGAFDTSLLGERLFDVGGGAAANLGETLASITVEFKIKGAGALWDFAFRRSTSNNTACTFYVDFSVGRIALINSNNVTLFSSSAGLFSSAAEIRVGVHVDIGSSGGFSIHLNGVSIGSGSNVDTEGTLGDTVIDQLKFTNNTNVGKIGSLSIQPTGFIDEARITTNNTPVANIEIGFASSTGNANYTNIDQGTQTADYNSASASGTRDGFQILAVDGGLNTIAVQSKIYAWKDDVGLKQFKFYVKIGSTRYYSPAVTLSTTSSWYTYSWITNPATSAAWTPTDINNAAFGYEVV